MLKKQQNEEKEEMWGNWRLRLEKTNCKVEEQINR